MSGGPPYPRHDASRSAFPHSLFAGKSEKGMSLRDYFAGQALAGIVSGGTHGDPIDTLAALAYATTDAMIKERERL